MEKLTLGGGCFWCLEAVFQRQPGVLSVSSGYAGGNKPDPTYKEVCAGSTGHAEVIQIEFDPAVISLQKLLDIFWLCHDPTTPNRQGADVGTQYRSIILTNSDAQKGEAVRSRESAQSHFKSPIVTEIVPLTKYYEAELYHQNYYNDNRTQGYCNFVIKPKLDKLGLK